ncbi:uncharacterized protein KQ657_004366 [Scheffersomyces spartinae]|uniref:Uncharacterized protein n=1 Tax=Scheffersomyces spartinae TaxID=45513 RepID=A0A9P7VB27_9ASCO|nr:uncharacterized protein KQ657_004366 [Scheffersomyces spartinae]KAG7194689.1 hypothetical protein KQ657_004366 [Scheffersomyces spartinae]
MTSPLAIAPRLDDSDHSSDIPIKRRKLSEQNSDNGSTGVHPPYDNDFALSNNEVSPRTGTVPNNKSSPHRNSVSPTLLPPSLDFSLPFGHLIPHNPTDDLIQLLSISKVLHSILDTHDSIVIDNFFIGFNHLCQMKQYPCTITMALDLLKYLAIYNTTTSNNVGSGDNKRDKNLDISKFKLCQIYAIISLGYNINDDFDNGRVYFENSWDLLVTDLIPNTFTKLFDQVEIMNNMFIVTVTFLQFHNKLLTPDVNLKVIINYFNDISFVVYSNLLNLNKCLLTDSRILFWCVYNLLLKYLPVANGSEFQPLKLYQAFLNSKFINDMTLNSVLQNSCRSAISFPAKNNEELIFLQLIVIYTLSNELFHFVGCKKFQVFDNKNSLHNSVILINKSMSFTGANFAPSNKIFELFKKKLIINSPLKFHELLNNYIIQLSSFHTWYLLMLTLKEFNLGLNDLSKLTLQLMDTSQRTPPPSPKELVEDKFFNIYNQIDIVNNNISIVCFPIIFNYNLLKQQPSHPNKFSSLERDSLVKFFVEWYLSMIKLLVGIFKYKSLDNYVNQSLIYLLNQNTSQVLPEEMAFDEDSFWDLKGKIELIFKRYVVDLCLYPDFDILQDNLNSYLIPVIKQHLNFAKSNSTTSAVAVAQSKTSVTTKYTSSELPSVVSAQNIYGGGSGSGSGDDMGYNRSPKSVGPRHSITLPSPMNRRSHSISIGMLQSKFPPPMSNVTVSPVPSSHGHLNSTSSSFPSTLQVPGSGRSNSNGGSIGGGSIIVNGSSISGLSAHSSVSSSSNYSTYSINQSSSMTATLSPPCQPQQLVSKLLPPPLEAILPSTPTMHQQRAGPATGHTFYGATNTTNNLGTPLLANSTIPPPLTGGGGAGGSHIFPSLALPLPNQPVVTPLYMYTNGAGTDGKSANGFK